MFYNFRQLTLPAFCFISLALSPGCASDSESAPSKTPSSVASDPLLSQSANEAPERRREIVSGQENSGSTNTESDTKNNSTVSTAENADTYDASDQYVNGKKLSIPKITGSVPPRDDSYHDTDNSAIVVLQSPTEAMAKFPRDRREEVDWVKALDRGFIEPRADLKGQNQMMTMDLDIVMKNTQFMPWVKFPHLAHTKWLDCSNCHPNIFIPQENANPISMNKVLRGEYCGVCHDKVSFSLFICERCHSMPHEGSGPAWWKTENE